MNIEILIKGMKTGEIKKMLRSSLPEMKYCKKGGHILPKTEFGSNGKQGLKPVCKTCFNKNFKNYYENNKKNWKEKYTPVNSARRKIREKKVEAPLEEKIIEGNNSTKNNDN